MTACEAQTRDILARNSDRATGGSKSIVTRSRRLLASRPVSSCHVMFTSRRFPPRVLLSCDIHDIPTVVPSSITVQTVHSVWPPPVHQHGVVLLNQDRLPPSHCPNLRGSVKSQVRIQARPRPRLQYSCKHTMASLRCLTQASPTSAASMGGHHPPENRGNKKVQQSAALELELRACGRGGQGLHPSCRPSGWETHQQTGPPSWSALSVLFYYVATNGDAR